MLSFSRGCTQKCRIVGPAKASVGHRTRSRHAGETTRLNVATNSPGFVDLSDQGTITLSRTRVSGLWRKLHTQCDKQDRLFDMFEVPWLVKQAVQLLNVIEIYDDDTSFTINVKTGLLDIRETYPWTGEPVTHNRRDMKAGKLTGQVTNTASGPIVSTIWNEPIAGMMHDAFFLDNDRTTLTQVTIAKRLDTKEAFTYKTVYHKIGTR